MSPEEAEAVLALHFEIAVAAQLAVDESAFRSDWRLRYAAERIVERVFQAAQVLPESLRGTARISVAPIPVRDLASYSASFKWRGRI